MHGVMKCTTSGCDLFILKKKYFLKFTTLTTYTQYQLKPFIYLWRKITERS